MAVAHRLAHCRRALIRPRSEDQHVVVGPSTHVVKAECQGLQIDGQEPCNQLCVQRVDTASCMFVTVNAKIGTLVFRNCVPVTLKIDGSVEAVVYVGNLHPNGGVAMIESENPPDTVSSFGGSPPVSLAYAVCRLFCFLGDRRGFSRK